MNKPKAKKTAEMVPTFVLKSIDPAEVMRKYSEGFYSRPIVQKKSIKTKGFVPILAEQISKNRDDGVYTEKFKNGASIIFVTANHKTSVLFKRTNDFPVGGRCDNFFCKREIPGSSMGYPVHYERRKFLEGDEYKIVHMFWVTSVCCNFHCAYNHLVNLRGSSFWNEDYERLIKVMYELMYPNGPVLCNINDPCILESNGGSVNQSDYDKYVYVKTPGVVIIPVSHDYIKM